jgi:hypothetical protein
MRGDAVEPGAAEAGPPVPIGLPTLARIAFDGIELAPVRASLEDRVRRTPNDAAALIDLATIAHMQGRPHDGAALQGRALALQRIYRQQPGTEASEPMKLLAFMAPGDFKANTPIEFILQRSPVRLDMAYVLPGAPLPDPLPEHDAALVAVAESQANQAILAQLAAAVRSWPRPVINAPERVARLTRDGTWALLKPAPGVAIPISARIERARLGEVARGEVAVDAVLEGCTFPIIARPLDSHAGEGLAKLDDRAAVDSYLQQRPEGAFYLSPFIDYRSPDGLFRKYRIALIAGRPYACHMAISQHWMIHYLNADMRARGERRAEEERFMATFDEDFAVRHAIALSAIAQRVGLEYCPFDCAELADGRLLVFEVGTNMIVHAMDPPEVFPYKGQQMAKLFGAFEAMLRGARPSPSSRPSAVSS